jgi:hypothetical protein
VISEQRAPVVTAASDLCFVLNDMNAHLADGLGSCEAPAAGVLLLEQPGASVAGRPSMAALVKYRPAIGLPRLTLLPGARQLADRQSALAVLALLFLGLRARLAEYR